MKLSYSQPLPSIFQICDSYITMFILSGSQDKLTFCKELGADVCINYKTEDFVARVKEETGGKGPFSYSSFKISVAIQNHTKKSFLLNLEIFNDRCRCYTGQCWGPLLPAEPQQLKCQRQAFYHRLPGRHNYRGKPRMYACKGPYCAR